MPANGRWDLIRRLKVNIRHEMLVEATKKKGWDRHVAQLEEIPNQLEFLVLNP